MTNDLVARLLAFEGEPHETTACWNGLRVEAADTIRALEKACTEWAEVSQRNYQRAKAADGAAARDVLVKHAADGLTLKEAAAKLGLAYSTTHARAKRLGVKFRDARADPEFAERSRERMKAMNADREFNPLASLTTKQRGDYDLLRRKGGLSRADALRAIGRADLVAADG